jgi:hypothetical protein
MSVMPSSVRYIDPSRTPWYDRFFSTWAFDTTEEMLEAIGSVVIPLDAVAKSDDLARQGLSGWLYWTLYVKGCLQYRDGVALDAENVYLDYLIHYGHVHSHDPVLADEFADPESAPARAKLRFEDFEAIWRGPDASALPTITCRVLQEPQLDTKILVDCDSGEEIAASDIDGYHRLFLARLFGLPRLPCEVSVETPPG